MQAAIGCAQLEKIDDFILARKNNYNKFKNKLVDIPNLRLFEKYEDADPSWFGALIEVLPNASYSRNDLTKYLEDSKIQTRNLFAGNILKHPCFTYLTKNVDYRVVGELLVTNDVMNNFFWLGLYPGITDEKIDYIISTLKQYI